MVSLPTSLRNNLAARLAFAGALGALIFGALGPGGAALAAQPAETDPTIAVFELYYAGKSFSKTPEYVTKITQRIVKEGGFDVINRIDADKPIKEKFPETREMKISNKADEISKLVNAAETDFFERGPQAALEKLRRAQAQLKEVVDSMSLTEELKKQYLSTQMLLALVYLRSDSPDKAEEVMRSVVRQVGQEPTINEDNYNPEVVTLYRDVYRSMSEQRIGRIMVRTTPPGAEVYINGLKQQRKTPATYEGLFPGEILLQVKKGKKASRVRKVLIDTDKKTQEFNIDLNFEAALAFSGKEFGLRFLSEQDRKRNLPKFAARLGELVDADYVALVGLSEREGETQIEGYLVHVETDKVVRETAMPTRANVVAKRRIGQMARFIIFGDAPQVVYKPWYSNTLGWVLTGVGVAGGALGAVFYSSYSSDRDIATCDPGTVLEDSPCEPESVRQDAKDSANSSRALAYASWGVGGASLIGGILVFALMRDEDLDAPIRPRVPGSAGDASAFVVPTLLPEGGAALQAGFSF